MVHTGSARATVTRLHLRFSVWRQRCSLDAALAAGADPADDPALALRAGQLTDASSRSALANTIRNVLDAAEEPHEAWRRGGPRPPLQRAAVLAARGELETVAEQLRQRPSVAPRAVALASLLVWDSASPLYAPDCPASVAAWTQTVCDSLDVDPAAAAPAQAGQRRLAAA